MTTDSYATNRKGKDANGRVQALKQGMAFWNQRQREAKGTTGPEVEDGKRGKISTCVGFRSHRRKGRNALRQRKIEKIPDCSVLLG